MLLAELGGSITELSVTDYRRGLGGKGVTVRLKSSARESIVNYWAGTKLRSLCN
jgi:hypothetical protein